MSVFSSTWPTYILGANAAWPTSILICIGVMNTFIIYIVPGGVAPSVMLPLVPSHPLVVMPSPLFTLRMGKKTVKFRHSNNHNSPLTNMDTIP